MSNNQILSEKPIKLTSQNYEQYVTDTSDIIIDFSAKWCGPCQRMKPHFDAADKFMRQTNIKLTFATVDVDDDSELASLFDVQCMPTIIIIKHGTEVDRVEGFNTHDAILLLIGKHFDVMAAADLKEDHKISLDNDVKKDHDTEPYTTDEEDTDGEDEAILTPAVESVTTNSMETSENLPDEQLRAHLDK